MEFFLFMVFVFGPVLFFECCYYNYPIDEKTKKCNRMGVLSTLTIIFGLLIGIPTSIVSENSTQLFNIYPKNTIITFFMPIFALLAFLFYFCNVKFDNKYFDSKATLAPIFKQFRLFVILIMSFFYTICLCNSLNYSFAKKYDVRYVEISEITRDYHSSKGGSYYTYNAVLRKPLLDTKEIALGRRAPSGSYPFIGDYKNNWIKISVYEGAIGIPFVEAKGVALISKSEVPKRLIAENEDLKDRLKPKTLNKNLPMNGY